MRNRRDVMKMAAGAGAVALAVPTASDAIIGCWSTPKDTPCPGECADGLVGMYPNCYYPQYRNINVTWLNNWQAAVVSGYSSAKKSRTMSPALLSSVQSGVSSLAGHLLSTQAHEGFRKQWVGESIWNAPNSQGANGLVDSLSPLGIAPSDIETAYYTASPNLSSYASSSYPALSAKINQFPSVVASLDNAQSIFTGDISSMFINPVGSLCTSEGGGSKLLEGSGALAGISWILMESAPFTGPAAPFVEAAGMILGAAASFMAIAGLICEMEGY